MNDSLNSSSQLNLQLVEQLAKAIHEPLLICNTNFKTVYFNNLFSQLITDVKKDCSVKELLNINPSLTPITQNYFSDALNSLLKINPLLLDGNLEGFIITLELADNQIDKRKSKPAFRAAAHDLNNILTNILNSIDLLKQPDSAGIPKEKLLNIIENNSNRASDIIETVLRKNDKKTHAHTKLDLNTLLEEISTSFRLFLPDRIKFIKNIQYGLPCVMGNHTELYRSIYNLLINAKEAIEGKGEISLTANQLLPISENSVSRQKFVAIKINDSGSGIEEEAKQRIFDEGFSTKDKTFISGIGLNNVKNIVENHDGKIIVNSAPGEGSSFEIHLPVIEQKRGAIVDEIKKILIAEDEDTLRELLKDLFESYDFEVTTVKDGIELMKTYNNDPYYDLLIIDKKMPDMDGLECIVEIRKTNSRIPIILATGSTAQDLKELEDIYKIQKALKKPYKFDDLLRIVNKSFIF